MTNIAITPNSTNTTMTADPRLERGVTRGAVFLPRCESSPSPLNGLKGETAGVRGETVRLIFRFIYNALMKLSRSLECEERFYSCWLFPRGQLDLPTPGGNVSVTGFFHPGDFYVREKYLPALLRVS